MSTKVISVEEASQAKPVSVEPSLFYFSVVDSHRARVEIGVLADDITAAFTKLSVFLVDHNFAHSFELDIQMKQCAEDRPGVWLIDSYDRDE